MVRPTENRRHRNSLVVIPTLLAIVMGLSGRILSKTSIPWGKAADDILSLGMTLCLSTVFVYVGWHLCQFRATRIVFALAITFLTLVNTQFLIDFVPGAEFIPLIGANAPERRLIFSGLDFMSVGMMLIGFLMTIRELGAVVDALQIREAEHNATQATLLEQEQRYRHLVEDASEIIYWIALDGTISYVSPSGFRSMGYQPEEVVGRNCLEFAHPDHVEALRSETQRMLEERIDSPVHQEFRAIRKDGSICWIGQTIRLIVNDGVPEYFHLVAEDITARRSADEALRESQAQIEQILNQVPITFWTMDTDLVLRSNMGHALENFGMRAGENDGQTLESIVAKLDTDTEFIMEKHRRALAGESVRYQVHVRGRTLQAALQPMYDDAGVLTGILGVSLDVTDSEAREAALAESENRYQALLEATNLIPWEFDVEQDTFTYVGPQAVTTGYPIEEWYTKGFWEKHIHPEDREHAVNYCHTHSEHAESYDFEYRFLAANGEVIWYRDIVSVTKVDGKLKWLRGVFVDITAQKLAEEALAENEERYRVLYESTPIMMFSTDTDGKVLNINEFWLSTLGYSRDEVVGRPIWTFLAKGTEHETHKDWARFWKEGMVHEAARQFRTRDGDIVDVLLSAIAIGAEDSASRTSLAYAVDVTERKRVEREKEQFESRLQHTQKLESLGVLAGGIAHDFNNLLMGVLGNASLALLEMDEDSPMRRPLQDIETAARRAAALSGQMLAYSGRGAFVMRPLSLNSVVEEVRQLLGASISKRVEITMDLANNVPPIEGDEAQINQVCMNLVINGAEAIGEGTGTVHISTSVQHCDPSLFKEYLFAEGAMPAGDYVLLTVTDNGGGMTEEVRRRIFEPFFTTKFTGRGLGMAVVLGIVRSHHGAIRMDSRLGEGTTLTVAFPASKSHIPAVAHTGATNGNGRWHHGGTALVVDDEPVVCTVAQRTLERCGMTVMTANDGLAGLNTFREHEGTIDIIILDLTMPIMSGAEVYKKIREFNREVPVLLSSGYSSQDVIDIVGKPGDPVAFLQKPYGSNQLVDEVRALLEADATSKA